MTKNPTACLMCLSSSQDVPAYSSFAWPHHSSSSAKPAFTYSPLLNVQHSRRRRRLLNNCTLIYEKVWVKIFWIRKNFVSMY
uniref:Myosin heavy chain family protein n=1 Tax=Rhizophora mucronata TaxID=61149 RepID=A0A2P2MTY4_RHIMU